jgi:hypothetical protein
MVYLFAHALKGRFNMSSLVSDQTPLSTLTAIQKRPDAPFGMLFLGIHVSLSASPLFGDKKITTQTNEETSLDGRSKLDPIYDEDENEDEEIPEKY